MKNNNLQKGQSQELLFQSVFSKLKPINFTHPISQTPKQVFFVWIELIVWFRSTLIVQMELEKKILRCQGQIQDSVQGGGAPIL